MLKRRRCGNGVVGEDCVAHHEGHEDVVRARAADRPSVVLDLLPLVLVVQQAGEGRLGTDRGGVGVDDRSDVILEGTAVRQKATAPSVRAAPVATLEAAHARSTRGTRGTSGTTQREGTRTRRHGARSEGTTSRKRKPQLRVPLFSPSNRLKGER